MAQAFKAIAFSIQKGGTGKTTISTNVAFHLSTKYKTVIVDCDPQGNASTNYITENVEYELVDVLRGKVELEEALVQVRDNLYILPTFGLSPELKEYAEGKLSREPMIFEELNEELDRVGFEYAIYDLSPGLSQLERSAIQACHEVVTPTLPEFYSLDGIEIFTNALKEINKGFRKNVRYNKCVINNLNASIKLHKEVRDAMMKYEGLQFFVVPQDSGIKYAQMENKSIFEYQRKTDLIPGLSKSADPIRDLAEVL